MRRIIRKFAQNKQANKQANKHTKKQRFQIQSHSYPLWIVGGSGPIGADVYGHTLTTVVEVEKMLQTDREIENRETEQRVYPSLVKLWEWCSNRYII